MSEEYPDASDYIARRVRHVLHEKSLREIAQQVAAIELEERDRPQLIWRLGLLLVLICVCLVGLGFGYLHFFRF